MEYRNAIEKSVSFLKEQIDNSTDKSIRILVSDIKVALGPEFEKKSTISIYWGVKAALIREGMVVDKGKSVTGEDLIIMRMTTPEDWKNVAELIADLMAGHHLLKWEYPNIIGDNLDRWREFVIENFITQN